MSYNVKKEKQRADGKHTRPRVWNSAPRRIDSLVCGEGAAKTACEAHALPGDEALGATGPFYRFNNFNYLTATKR
jgi:hypothetical protein